MFNQTEINQNILGFDQYVQTLNFRASEIANLKISKGKLTQTAISLLLQIYNRTVFGFERELENVYMKKGLFCEDKAISEISLLEKEEFYDFSTFQKNETKFENEFVRGIPDVVLVNQETFIEIKCSFDLQTFQSFDQSDYYDQVQSYIWLLEEEFGICEFGYLICGLLSTPPHLLARYNKTIEEFDMLCQMNDFEANIAMPLRYKVFKIYKDLEWRTEKKKAVLLAREYLQNFNLRNKEILEKYKICLPLQDSFF